jgi:hypothetical protein
MHSRMTRIALRAAIAIALLGAFFVPGAARAVCPGDCNELGSVEISELIRGVNIALGSLPVSSCPAFDTDSSGSVAVNELIAAVRAALDGCPPEPPTVTPTVTASPTATIAIEPIFPANYRDTFVEVRDCRLAIEHGGVMIRVFANSLAAEPYRRLENPLPAGSIVIKEEYDGVDCNGDLFRWTAMRKEAPGFDPDDGDWSWQRLDAPSRQVTCNDKGCPGFPCIACHRAPACKARDYMCTEAPRGTLRTVLEHLPAAVLSISGRSPTDVYAVGGDPNDGRGPLVLQYDGGGWRRLDSGATGALWWISVTPIDGDFYMVGEGGLILQFDPSDGQFTRHTTPDDTATLFGIWGTAANDLWAVGGGAQQQAVVWRFDGMMWTVQDVSNIVPQGVPTTLNKVFGRAANDIFAVGETGVILHFDGVAWSLVPSGVSTQLFTIHGGGSVLAAVGGFQEGQILERNDSGSFISRAPSGTPRLNGVFVPPSGDAVAVGISLAVAARSASGWTLVDEGTDPLLRDFHAVWIDSEDGIWAVGGDLGFLTDGVLAYGGPQTVPGGPVQ